MVKTTIDNGGAKNQLVQDENRTFCKRQNIIIRSVNNHPYVPIIAVACCFALLFGLMMSAQRGGRVSEIILAASIGLALSTFSVFLVEYENARAENKRLNIIREEILRNLFQKLTRLCSIFASNYQCTTTQNCKNLEPSNWLCWARKFRENLKSLEVSENKDLVLPGIKERMAKSIKDVVKDANRILLELNPQLLHLTVIGAISAEERMDLVTMSHCLTEISTHSFEEKMWEQLEVLYNDIESFPDYRRINSTKFRDTLVLHWDGEKD